MDEQGALARKLATILPQLNERQRRLILAAEARALGQGGVTRVARAAQVSRTTVHAWSYPDSVESLRLGHGAGVT